MDRRSNDRRPARDDNRNHKPRYEQDRSRSPPRRDRRDDRRRDRSPARNGPPSRNVPPPRADRDRESERAREPARGGGAGRGRPGERPPVRDPVDTKQNGTAAKIQQAAREGKNSDTRMENGLEDEDSEAEMARTMGFKDFRSTKNTKVPGNDKNYGVYKAKKSEYRQYMNRTGGFNRPLDAM